MTSLNIKKRKDGSFVIEAISDGRTVVCGGGATPRDAARWLVRHINRVAEEIEQAVIDLDLLPENEIISIADGAGA